MPLLSASVWVCIVYWLRWTNAKSLRFYANKQFKYIFDFMLVCRLFACTFSAVMLARHRTPFAYAMCVYRRDAFKTKFRVWKECRMLCHCNGPLWHMTKSYAIQTMGEKTHNFFYWVIKYILICERKEHFKCSCRYTHTFTLDTNRIRFRIEAASQQLTLSLSIFFKTKLVNRKCEFPICCGIQELLLDFIHCGLSSFNKSSARISIHNKHKNICKCSRPRCIQVYDTIDNEFFHFCPRKEK